MGRIVVTEFISLDGVVEDPGGSENFRHGGWSFAISSGDDGREFKVEETRASDAQLLGRVTYEGFAEAWPSRDGEFADLFNSMPKYVVSSTLTDPEWNNSTVLTGDLAGEVAKLKARYERDIVVHGSVTARTVADRGRSRRRVAPDGLSGRAGSRPAPVRRDQRQEDVPARILASRRRRRGDSRLPARMTGACRSARMMRTYVRAQRGEHPPRRRRLVLRVGRAAGRSAPARASRDRGLLGRARGELRGQGLWHPHGHERLAGAQAVPAGDRRRPALRGL